jgi:hypothetical protein
MCFARRRLEKGQQDKQEKQYETAMNKKTSSCSQNAYTPHYSKCLNVALIIASKFVGIATPKKCVLIRGYFSGVCKVSAVNIGEAKLENGWGTVR